LSQNGPQSWQDILDKYICNDSWGKTLRTFFTSVAKGAQNSSVKDSCTVTIQGGSPLLSCGSLKILVADC